MEVETVIVVNGYTLEEAICKELGFYLMTNKMPMKSTGKLQPDLHLLKVEMITIGREIESLGGSGLWESRQSI